MKNYDNLAKEIIGNIGGKDNVDSLTHCVTRLRFMLKDETKANDDGVKALDGVVTLVKSAGQYQVVIGNHVPDVYARIIDQVGISKTTETDESPKMSLKEQVFDMVTAIMMPSISIMAASGMIQGLNIIFEVIGLYSNTSSYYVLVEAIGKSFMYFFPIFLGYNTAVKLKISPFLGMAIGAILCYPTINGVDLRLFGISLNVTYTSTVLPVIAMVFLAAPISRYLNKTIPDVIKSFFSPMFTLLIVIPIGYIVIGPLATALGNFIGSGISTLLSFSPIIGGFISGSLWQIIVMFGVHSAVLIPSLVNLTSGVPDSFITFISIVSFSQLAVVFGMWLRTTNKELKGIALPAWISALFGVTEPAIYGVTLPRIKMFVLSCIGGGVGGAILGALDVKTYALGGSGIFILPTLISPSGDISGVVSYIIATIATLLFSFFGTLILYRDHETVSETVTPTVKEVSISAPLEGKVIKLNDVSDPAFSSGALGKGVAILPIQGCVFSPVSGTVTTLFPTKHAIGITDDNGIEILIHVGMDTVTLDGEGFTAHVKQNDQVDRGQLLLEADLELLKEKDLSTETPIVITNFHNMKTILETQLENVSYQDELIRVTI